MNIMECSKVNCSTTGNTRMVSCWLCMSLYHLICSGLKARNADALADPQKFLHWTCPDCRKVNIEFYNLFKDSKSKFNKINEDLLELQKKFTEFGELFSKYPNLEKFVNTQHIASPKLKRDGLRSATNQNVSPLPLPTDDPNDNVILTPSCELQPPYFQNNCTSSSNILNSISSLPGSFDNTSVTSKSNYSHPILSVINTPNISQPNQTSSKAVPIVPDNNNSKEISPKPLRVIPPARSIFISRLASDTTITDIEFYIRSKIGANCNLSIYKFTYSQPRSISSFKITVPDEFFGNILDLNFWPASTLVREYVFSERRQNVVRLPAPQISKN